jgi:hypothetical protein
MHQKREYDPEMANCAEKKVDHEVDHLNELEKSNAAVWNQQKTHGNT